MATVFKSQGVGQPIIVKELIDKYGKAKTGRWAYPPSAPDRCEFCPLSDIKPSIGFVTDKDGWRYGFCQEHKTEAEKSIK